MDLLRKLQCNKGFCGGGKPSIPATPVVAPRPTPEPEESSPAGKKNARDKRVEQYRRGFASTIKTSPTGLQNEGAAGGKTKLGQ